MKQSAYLIQQRETRRRLVQAAERVTQQLMLDTLQVTLHQEFGFGYDRIKRLTDAWGQTYGCRMERGGILPARRRRKGSGNWTCCKGRARLRACAARCRLS